jgi:hypothetical protein
MQQSLTKKNSKVEGEADTRVMNNFVLPAIDHCIEELQSYMDEINNYVSQ